MIKWIWRILILHAAVMPVIGISLKEQALPVSIEKNDIEILHDAHLGQGFFEIENHPGFKKPQGKAENWFAKVEPVYWLRFTVENYFHEELYLAESFTTALWKKISMHARCGGGIYEGMTGVIVPVKERDVPGGDHIIKLPPCRGKYMMYVRLEANVDPVYRSFLEINTLPSFLKKFERYMIIHAFYLGIILIMTAYNLLLFVYSGDRAFLYYSLASFFNGILWIHITEFATEVLWHDIPAVALYIGIYGAFISLFISVLFIRTFLKLNIQDKKADNIFLGFQWFFLFLPMLSKIISWEAISVALSLTTILFTVGFLVVATRLVWKGFKPALFLLAGWSGVSISLILYPLGLLGIIELDYYIYYSIEFGTALEMIIFSFGLGYRFNELEKEKEALALQSRAIDMELEMAQKIQTSLMTKTDSPGIACIYEPMRKVGGDFYEIIELDIEKTGFFLSDVCGHGIPASLLTILIKGIISDQIKGLVRGNQELPLYLPTEMLLKINEQIKPSLGSEYLTAVYAILDRKNREVKMAGSSHPPPILLYDGEGGKRKLEFLSLSPQLPPLGIFNSGEVRKMKFGEKKFKLPDNGYLILYSDGFTDRFGYTYEEMEKGLDSFKTSDLFMAFSQIPYGEPRIFTEKLRELSNSVKKENEDDICVIVISL